MENIFESGTSPDLQEDNSEGLLQANFLQRYTKTEGVEDHGKEFEKAVCMLYALKLLADDDVFDFTMTSNNKVYGIFDDMALDVKFKNDSKCLFLFQLKYREGKEPITQHMLTKKTQQLDKKHVKSKFYLPNYVDTINGLDIEDEEVVNILYTNRPVEVENAKIISFKPQAYGLKVLQCDEVKNENVILNKQFQKNGFLQFAPVVDPDSREKTKLEKACKQFFILSEDNSLQTIHDNVREKLMDLLCCDVYGLYEHFMRNWWSDNFVLTKDYLITKLSEIALLHDVQTISALKYNEKTEIIRDAIMQFGVTMVDESQKDVARSIWPEADDQIPDFPAYLIPGTEALVQKAIMLWTLGKVPMIVKVDDTNKKRVLSVVRLLRKNIKSKSVVLLGNRDKGDFEEFI